MGGDGTFNQSTALTTGLPEFLFRFNDGVGLNQQARNKLHRGYLYRRPAVANALAIVDRALALLPRASARPQLPTPLRKILIVKPDHLGDFILVSALIPFLKEMFPSAEIDFVIGSWNQGLAAAYPEIRKIWIIDHPMLNRNGRLASKIIKFVRDSLVAIPGIRAEGYDLALFLRPFGGNFVFLSPLFGAKATAGHGTGGGGPLLSFCAQWKEGVHEVQHFAEVLHAAGISAADGSLKPFFPSVVTELQLPPPYICVHPGAGHPSKLLSPQEWKEILGEKGIAIAVCGTAAEAKWVDSLRQVLSSPVVDFTGKLSFLELQGLMRNAEEVHTLDSFAAHFASAAGSKQVVVHFRGASDPVQWRPIGANVIVHRLTSSPTTADLK